MNTKPFIVVSIVILDLCTGPARAQQVSFQGQVSGWITSVNPVSAGVRCLPQMNVSKDLGDKKLIDSELALNAYASGPLAENTAGGTAQLKLHRFTVRYAAPQFEARAGLQKISFGPAKILRSLMWFDTLDPRDPLQLTDGVSGLLLRYYFLDNANLWLWGLAGNTALKGLEQFKSDNDRLETGCRCQIPLPGGEMGLTVNRRYLDKTDWLTKLSPPLSDGAENRVAVDGSWDLGIGVWFEDSCQTVQTAGPGIVQNYCTLGSDYTFKPGVHVTVEHFMHAADRSLPVDRSASLSAVMADYPSGITDNYIAIIYYDWNQRLGYPFGGWQRTYDKWQFNLMAYSVPAGASPLFSGNGIELLVTFNH